MLLLTWVGKLICNPQSLIIGFTAAEYALNVKLSFYHVRPSEPPPSLSPKKFDGFPIVCASTRTVGCVAGACCPVTAAACM